MIKLYVELFSNSGGERKPPISHQPFKITSAHDGEKLVWGETIIKLEFYITIIYIIIHM